MHLESEKIALVKKIRAVKVRLIAVIAQLTNVAKKQQQVKNIEKVNFKAS